MVPNATQGCELTGKQAADIVTNLAASVRGTRRKEFLDAMKNEHPTLQQAFTHLCADWIETMATVQGVDARNLASSAFCKMVVKEIPEKMRYFPFI